MTSLRHAVLIGVPLAFSALLWFHPMIGDSLASIGWACFAAAGWLVLRAHHTAVEKPAAVTAAEGSQS